MGSRPKDLTEKLTGLGDLLDQKSKATVGVAGTFNAAEARGLAGGGVADRIGNATEGCSTQLNAIRFAWSGGKIVEAT